MFALTMGISIGCTPPYTCHDLTAAGRKCCSRGLPQLQKSISKHSSLMSCLLQKLEVLVVESTRVRRPALDRLHLAIPGLQVLKC